ncbi:GNAT family N-acetyltransferase [Streptomyces sp. NPDC058739]|uniref:GNAT family N-acetyltransferase n=1 Tax=Streptomyces sp. NPDC058739 TaxID=3346618 RepID=UPI0036BAE570
MPPLPPPEEPPPSSARPLLEQLKPTERHLRIRHARKPDLPQLVRLDGEVFPHMPYPYFVLRQFLDAFQEHTLVLDDSSGELHGYVMSTGAGGPQAWILTLGVAPTLHGQGWGRRLMEAMLDHLRRRGTGTVNLAVDPANDPAIALYHSLGFTASPGGPRLDYFGPGEHRLLMTLTL